MQSEKSVAKATSFPGPRSQGRAPANEVAAKGYI